MTPKACKRLAEIDVPIMLAAREGVVAKLLGSSQFPVESIPGSAWSQLKQLQIVGDVLELQWQSSQGP